MGHEKTRRHSKVDKLPPEIKAEANRLLLEDVTYEEMENWSAEKGFDISKSSWGRYGKVFFNQLKRIRQVEDMARTLVAEVGENNMIIEEAASKAFARKMFELLLDDEKLDLTKVPRIMSDFAKLQASTIAREKAKSDLQKKVTATAESVAKTAASKGLSKDSVDEIKKVILGLQK